MSREQIALICELYANGYNMRQIAKTIRQGMYFVSKVLHENYIPTTSKTPVHIIKQSGV